MSKKGNNIQKKNIEKKNEIKYEAQPDVQLTPYTAIAMITILVAGIVTAMGAIVIAKPIYNFLLSIYSEIDPGLVEVLAEALFEGELGNKINVILTVSVVMAGISAVISLIAMIRAMNPNKKPLVILTWVALIFAVAAIVLYVVGSKMIYDNCDFADFVKKITMNIYVGAGIAYIVNLLFMIINIVGHYMGLSRYKKDGKAY